MIRLLSSGRFSLPIFGGFFMWNMITHFLTFTGGMSAGVVLMCLLQAAKHEDEWLENRKLLSAKPTNLFSQQEPAETGAAPMY